MNNFGILISIIFALFASSACKPMNNKNSGKDKLDKRQEIKEIEVKKKKKVMEEKKFIDDNIYKKYSQQLMKLVDGGNEELFKVVCQDPKLRSTIQKVLKTSNHTNKTTFVNIFRKCKNKLKQNSSAQLTPYTCSIEALIFVLKYIKYSGYDNFSTYDFLRLTMERNPMTIIRLHGGFCKKMIKSLKMSRDEHKIKSVKLFNKGKNYIFTGLGAHQMKYEIDNLHKHDPKYNKLYAKLINVKSENLEKTIRNIVKDNKIPLLMYKYENEWGWHTFAIVEYMVSGKHIGNYRCNDRGIETFYTFDYISEYAGIRNIPWFMRLEFNWIFPIILYIKRFRLFKTWVNPLKVEAEGTYTFVAVHKDKKLIDSIK